MPAVILVIFVVLVAFVRDATITLAQACLVWGVVSLLTSVAAGIGLGSFTGTFWRHFSVTLALMWGVPAFVYFVLWGLSAAWSALG